jgi:glucose-1-phosphate adenylyltransferase
MENVTHKVLTFVLAGGKGERLFPLTRDRAKPAVPFGGIYRIIDFTLSNCLNSGFRRINVLTQYKSISLDRHIRQAWSIFNYELDEYLQVIPAQQRIGEAWYRGTADAIYQNLYSIERARPEYIVVLAGDHIYKMDYMKMLESHISRGADVTITALETDAKAASRQLGVLVVNEESRVKEFQEKPEEPACLPAKPGRCLASMGIYIFTTSKLIEVLAETGKIEALYDFGRHIIPYMILRGNRVFSYLFQD